MSWNPSPLDGRDGCYATEGAEGDLGVNGSGDVVRRKGFESMCQSGIR